MNHIYRSIWSESLATWIAVPENTKDKAKSNKASRLKIAHPLKNRPSGAHLLATGLLLYSSASWALPTGEQLVAGQAAVSTPTTGQMQIDQTSQQAIINWQGFSINPNEAVNIHQPNAQAALLNRVVGQDASQIQGQLNANGQVYLVNPNGVLFSKTAQVDVGGLVASTHNIKDADFLNGNQHFTQDSSTANVDNQGTIKTPEGGVVALIGIQVNNSGSITAPKGTAIFAAGKTVDLDFKGDGLVEVKVSEAALNAQINNNGAILADGGRVILTAKAAGQLIDTVINQDGIIRAQGMSERNGEIILDGGDSGVTQINGTLNADGQTGGKVSIMGKEVQINNGASVTASGESGGGVITVGDKQTTNLTTINQGASITAQTQGSGTAGTINVLANMDSGTVNVAGNLDASAPQNGDGGFIDTSAAHVKVADSAKISTKAETGKTGTWLIDPNDYTIAASGGDITGTALGSNLDTSDVIISSTQGNVTGNGDIFVNDSISSASGTNSLTLNAIHNIDISATINTAGIVNLRADSAGACIAGASSCGTINFGCATIAAGTINLYYNPISSNNAADPNGIGPSYTTPTNYSSFVTGTLNAYMLVNDVNQLQAINTNLAGKYALGKNIDASTTSSWNFNGTLNQGFLPIGNSTNRFSGIFDGLGHTITGLIINRPTATDNVGMFSTVSGGNIKNIGLIGGSITGLDSVGSLVGYNGNTATIISNVYATSNVTGRNFVGGLVGNNVNSTISNAYATGQITGSDYVGGLVGQNVGSFVSNTYATGSVTGTGSFVGGLIGFNNSNVTNSFSDTQTTLQANAIGLNTGSSTGTAGKTTAEMKQASTFLAWGTDISATGGSTAVWRIYEGNSAPLLRNFLTLLTVTADNISKTYNGVSDSILSNVTYSTTPNANLLGTATYGIAKNVGSYTATGLYSNQQGYDISLVNGGLTITPAALTVSASDFTKGYDGTTTIANGTATVSNGTTLFGDTLSGGLFAYADKNAGSNKTVTISNVTVNDGNSGGNYNVSYADNTTSTITQALLTLSVGDVTKSYDGNTSVANGTATVSSGTVFLGDSLSGGLFAYADKNAGSNKTVTISNVTVNDGNSGGNYNVSYADNTTSTITQALLTLSVSDVTKSYDGNTSVANGTATVSSGTVFLGDSLSGGLFAYADKNAGSNKTVTISNVTVNDGNSGGNYNVSYADNTTSTITQALLTLSVGDVTKSYDGNTSVANGTATVSNGTVFLGDTLSGGLFAYTDKNVGSGNKIVTVANVTVGDGLNNGNYNVSYADNTTSTITPALLTYTAAPISHQYGIPNSAFTGTVTGFVNGESEATATTGTLSFTSAANVHNVGSYFITGSGLTANNGNYNFVQAAGNAGALSITPATLTYTATAVTRVYGSENPIFTGTVTGFVNGESEATATTGALRFDSLATNTSNVGNYAITGSGLTPNNGNYNFAQALTNSSALSITPATLTYTADAISLRLGNPFPTFFTGTVTGFVNSESQATATTGELMFSYVGGGTIDGSGLSANNGNYNFVQAESNSSALSLFFDFVGDAVAFELPPVVEVLSSVGDAVSFELPTVVVTRLADNISGLVSQTTTNSQGTTQLSQVAANFSTPPANKVLASGTTVDDTSGDFAEESSSSSSSDSLASSSLASDSLASSSSSNNSSSSSSSPSNNQLFSFISGQQDSKPLIVPTLTIKNSAGRVKGLQISPDKQFLSLFLEDGSVRVWDFQSGTQRQIVTDDKNQALIGISAVDDKGDLMSVASKTGIGAYDILGSISENKFAINEFDPRHFISSNDGHLLLVNTKTNELSLWDSQANKKLWQFPYLRGTVNRMSMSSNKLYGAVLSRQPEVYQMPAMSQLISVTDAVDIVDLVTGKVIQSLPNVGEDIIYMQFKGNDTLQLGLANGELLDWSITARRQKVIGGFAEPIDAIDNIKETYAYVTKDNSVRVGNGQGDIQLSIKNEQNPFQHAVLLEDGKKLLTVMASGDLALWDVASGKKMLRLFSTKQGGWTVMDAVGRFDGSDEAMENFSWLAGEENIPLNSFSENYYEPGLLASVLKNQDYLNSDSNAVKEGIGMPPKVALQLSEQQAKTDNVALQLNVYDRGAGIDKINIYHNGKMLNNANVVVTEKTEQENGAEHRVLTLNITPSAGNNTLRVTASNDMGIESNSSELSFDGKTKAYASSVRLLTIGINDYQESQLHLKYSVPDAELIGKVIENSSKITGSKSLINENATKPKILAELKELSQGSQQDVLIIYFAGHGVAMGKEWYFLPYETKLEPSLKKIVAAGISATELSDIFKNSKIQHILLMVDSCHSGASTDVFSTLQNGQRYFTRQLGRSLGITVITAAAKEQTAAEMKSLGHGLFTYLISEAIEKQDKTQPLTAHGIADNILKSLPAFSKKLLGTSQEPVIYTKGNDFMLTDLLKNKK